MTTMKAVTYSRYAGPEQMRVTDIPVPVPGEGQVRVRIAAASLNAYDWHIYRGQPILARTRFGLRSPGQRVLGSDAAGTVDALGPGVTGLAVGDVVFGGFGFGACGEFAVTSASSLAKVGGRAKAEKSGSGDTGLPSDATSPTARMLAAAALPMAGVTALQALQIAGVGQASRVLVIGASGGVGHLAVQIAKALGAARVVAVCSGANAAWVQALGADAVVDYRTARVESVGEKFDAVIDTVCTTALGKLSAVIAPGGIYVAVGGVAKTGLIGPYAAILRSQLAARVRRIRWGLVNAVYNTADLEQLATWREQGLVVPRIEAVYALDQVQQALTVLESQRAKGKLVISL